MNYLELSPAIARAAKKHDTIASFIYKGRGENSQEEKVFAALAAEAQRQSARRGNRLSLRLFAVRRSAIAHRDAMSITAEH